MNSQRRTWLPTLWASLLLVHAGCCIPRIVPSAHIDQIAQPVDVVSCEGRPFEKVPFQAQEKPNIEAASQPVVQVGNEQESAASSGSGECSANDTKPLTLIAAIQTALARNPDLTSAAERVEMAEGVLARARSEFFPKLSLGLDAAASNNPQTAFAFALSQGKFDLSSNLNNPGVMDDIHPQLLIQQDIYVGGRRLAQKQSAQANLEASQFARAEVQNQLVSQVAEAYYRLLQAREFVEVRQEAVEQVKRQLEVVRARIKAGAAIKSDALTVEVRLAEVEEALIVARNQMELSWALLERVIGSHLESRTLPEVVPPAPWTDRADRLEAIVAEAIQQRPEVERLASTRAAAEHDIRVAQSGRYPTISASSSYDVHTPDLGTGNQSFYVGLGVRMLLFDGGRIAADVRQAEAKMRELEARKASQVLEIELEVRRAYLELGNARERLRVTTKAVTLAQANLAETEALYRAQKALLTQVIDAQVALSNARVRRASVTADVEIARTQLQRVAGRLTNFAGTAKHD